MYKGYCAKCADKMFLKAEMSFIRVVLAVGLNLQFQNSQKFTRVKITIKETLNQIMGDNMSIFEELINTPLDTRLRNTNTDRQTPIKADNKLFLCPICRMSGNMKEIQTELKNY